MRNAPLGVCRISPPRHGEGDTGTTALIAAVGADSAELAMLLLAKGASMDGDVGGWFTPLVTAAQQGNAQMLALLLERRALIHKRGEWRMTETWLDDQQDIHELWDPLAMTAHSGHCAGARLLLDNGADVSQGR